LGQSGDRQAWVDAEICRQHGSVADVHIAVAEDTVMIVHHAAIGRTRDHATTDAMRGAGNIEENLRKDAHRRPPSDLRNSSCKLICPWNVGRHFITTADQHLVERPEPGTFPAHLDMTLQRLHAQENHVLSRPSLGPKQTRRLYRVAQQRAQNILQPEPYALRPGAAIS